MNNELMNNEDYQINKEKSYSCYFMININDRVVFYIFVFVLIKQSEAFMIYLIAHSIEKCNFLVKKIFFFSRTKKQFHS